MSELKTREPLKPFCPIHHWRMSHDAGSSKVQPSYRCNYESCTLRYTVAEGYFETGDTSGDSSLLSELQTVACLNNREHHPCIVGYAKESFGNQTQEWRHWECVTDGCDFSLRQKLSPTESARRNAVTFVPAHSQSTLLDFALSKR